MRNLELIASLASILGCVFAIYQIFSSDSEKVFISFFLMLICLFLFIITLIHLNHSKHYLKAFKKIQIIHHDVLKKQNEFNHSDLKDSISTLLDICSDISEMFTELRRHEISVCLKYTNQDNNQRYVKTLCRDYKSKRKRETLYNKKQEYNEEQDLTIKNSDFEKILNNIEAHSDWRDNYYYASWLPYKFQYKNSHLSDNTHYSLISRNKNWPLPYKSTIVVPIMYDNDNYGFLCVDSPKNRGFNSKFDIKIVQDLALLLAPTIRIVSEKHLKSQK